MNHISGKIEQLLALHKTLCKEYEGVNGESAYVYVCATPDEQKVLYFARKKKGHEGVKGTVTEDFQGILVHDHEITFYKY